ncbi:MAG: T9SS type A sorting domain-containing protein [Chitinophagales bacterium]|nr:T9SS type A sorting domain-containing protein [Chitinophagales bacterium]
MKSFIQYILISFLFISTQLFAGPGDTIKVQTFTFGSTQDAWFNLPSADVDVEKILMKYTLKCNPAQSPACGEWDYLTYTYLFDHTGVLDSTLLTHSNFQVNGTSPDTLDYSATPTYIYQPKWLYSIVYDAVTSLEAFQIGDGVLNTSFPMGSSEPRSKTQFIWSATEMMDAGMIAGDLTGLRFYIETPGSELHDFRIAIANTLDTEVDSVFADLDFTEVFHNNITPIASGWISIPFLHSFNWDGTSNICVQITFDNNSTGINTVLRASDIALERSIYSTGADKYLDVAQPFYGDVNGFPLNTLSDEVTVSWWSYGDTEFQPQNGTTFEVYNNLGNRVLNVHGPWSDGNFYWDAGASGSSYDRIYKNAPASDYEGTWTHWAFTKDAVAGVMKIYKNGVEWHSGTGKSYTMENAEKMRIGKGLWGGSESYYGMLNEFAVWDVSMDVATIQQYMNKNIDASHPFYDDLKLYYSFDNADGIDVNDDSEGDAQLINFGTQVRLLPAQSLYRNTNTSTLRPDVIWEQGIFTSHIDSVLVMDTIANDAMTIVLFDPASPTMGIDTFQVWPGDFYNYNYASDGTLLDSLYVANTDVMYKELYEYYSPPFEVIDRYELARYITPYGIGLDLGDGFTWTFDVSDYRTLLQDTVHLVAGNWQELLSLELWFIEGTPPREPLSVTNLWTGYKPYDSDESFDASTPPVEITIPANAINSRIKVRVTGHGFGGNLNCAEFCAMDHYFKVDGETTWTKNVWRDNCDVNPVYPQGGTWVYDRANWCPGAEVETYDFELTDFVEPGGTYSFDYAAQDYLWNGGGSFPYYQTEVQLITYAAPSFVVDAAVMDIVAPGKDPMWSRKNPICNNPIIRIQNTGSQSLTSLTIEYGMNDPSGSIPVTTYSWTGNLNIMEWEEIQLPDYAWSTSGEFKVEISEPNGVADPYVYNNTMITQVDIPAMVPNSIILEFKTNTKPNENDLFLYNSAGEEIFSRTTFTANTIYKDTIILEDDCYELYLWDSDGDGISWWANSDGIGYFRMRDGNTNAIIKNYQADFGGLIYQQFTVGNYVDINALTALNESVKVFPNPATDQVNFQLQLTNAEPVVMHIYNFDGKLVYSETKNMQNAQTIAMDVSSFSAGLYVAVFISGNTMLKTPFIVEH